MLLRAILIIIEELILIFLGYSRDHALNYCLPTIYTMYMFGRKYVSGVPPGTILRIVQLDPTVSSAYVFSSTSTEMLLPQSIREKFFSFFQTGSHLNAALE